MAKVWPAYEGRTENTGEPWADLPLDEAVSLLELRPEDFVSDLATAPRFGDAGRDLWYFGFKHVVVEISPSEARLPRWRPGFYRSRVKPKEASARLIQQALTAELGRENLVRVEHAAAVGSQGQDALKVTVVLAPNALRRLHGEASLNAVVGLQKRLLAMGDNRTPILQYATEAELAQDGGP